MSKKPKLKLSLIISVLLFAVVLPFVEVDAVTHTVWVSNPYPDESFSYFTTAELFWGVSSTMELTPNTEYCYHIYWYIDGVEIDYYADQKFSDYTGILSLNKLHLFTDVEISIYSVGNHNATLKVSIFSLPPESDLKATGSDTHNWSRDEAPTPPAPSVEFTNPLNPGVSYDYSTDTSYTCAWTITDEDDDITEMTLYMNDIEEEEFGAQPEGDYSYPVIMDTDQTYYLKVNGTDSESNDYSTSTSVVAYNASQYIGVDLPSGQYHNSEIFFQIESGAPDGLHNFSYTVGESGYWISNETSNNADVAMDTTWDYEYSLNPTQFVSAVDVIYGDRYESSEDYDFYKDIVVTNPTSTTLTNFVSYISVAWNSNMQPDFDDVAFYSTSGVALLDFDKAEYTASTTGHFWVEIPSFTGSGTYTTRMFYGKTGVSVEDEQGTWDDNNIELAMHLADNDDSSGNSYDFTDTGDGVSYSASQIGSGVELQGTDDYLLLPQGSSATELHSLGTSYTILSWMWCEDDTYYAQYSMTADILSLIFVPEAISDDIFRIEADSQYVSKTTSTSFTEDTYAHLTTRVDGTDIDWFVAGALVESNVWTADLGEADNDIFIGIEQALNNDMNGFIDELYVISEVWSDHEVEAFYEFQGDQGSWVSTGSEVSTLVLNNDILVSASYDTGYDTIDSDWFINFTATATCVVEWINITVVVYDTVFTVYSSSANTVQTDGFTLNDTAWASLSEGLFSMNISLYDDLDSFFTTNLTYYKDTTLPIVTLYSPENRTIDDPYSNLQIIPLSYKIEDDAVDDSAWENDMKWLIIDGEWFTGDDWIQYPKHKPLIFYQGLHTLNITAEDYAGNRDSASVSFYYEVRLDKLLTLTFTSSLDNETIDPEQYLNIYLDGMPISATTTTNLNNFTITVYDKFGILLNSTVYEYEATIEMELPLRPVVFENNNDIFCEYKITYGLFEKSFWIQADTNQTYYLNDTDYILVAEPGEEYFNETHWYGQTYISFTVESEMSEIEVILDLISDDPLHDPLVITLYDKDLDIDVGFIYVAYETSWGNTTVQVFDNATELGSAQSEGWTIWLFDTEDYGFHNITVFIYNGGDVVFEDGFSFYIEEPAPEDNYYLSVTTSVDVNGGLFYVTVNTFWDNCTIRVFDNEVPLGGNTSEGNSIWSFDEEVFGLHNFSIFIYQGYDLWDTIYTSVTIMAPDAETLSLTLYSVQFDVDSSYIYINYVTTWGNTTVQVFDNSSSLGDAVGGEELSIWTTTSDYGFHNITIIIYDDGAPWFTDVISFTIVEPSTETNYYQVLMVNIDAGAGQLFTSIHTYFGNCTVRVFDNSTPLGDNTTEGDIIWSFSTTYGLHNFSIVVYQGNDIWHTIYTSVTIVEPTPEESMLFTLFEKSVDADSGLFYLNYETNWGNTTCRVKDNSTWLGDNTTEQLSIWSFTTNYGLHNITIEFYNGNDLVYTDVTSFVIQEPDTEVNYYLTIDTSIDVSSGLFYVTINTYWDNCTIRVKDNSTWLGSAVDEGSSVWEFDESVYGLHIFNISVYQNGVLWDSIITSITIVEPDAETLSLTLYSVQFDIYSGYIYINYITTWGNTTVQVFDNSSSLGDAVGGEELSIWTTTTDYGWHNITVFIYDDSNPWFTDVFSFTIVSPDTETNYFEALSITIDPSAGQLFTSIHTYFGNCTIRVKDNSTWLGSNTTEGDIIWTFSTTYGLHNFSIYIYQGLDIWTIVYSSVTIVEPDAETNYYLTIDTSIDASGGLFYISIETYFGNCTIRVADNSTWLGDNVTEGSSIWSFDESVYGLHNFSIYVYQGYDLWNMIYTSVTIVEPAPEESMLFTLFEKSVDVSSGLFYLNYETNWGNTTCRVKDNSTWLGGNTTEQLSIWSFTTSYGLHNITIEIYNGNDLVYTDVTSFVIQEPDAETNYYLTIETSIDASGGLLYLSIETYFGNCTIRVADNSTWLGDNVTEGSSIWSFTETAYGLHNFSIFIYQGYGLWNMIYTSITIVEPDVEVLALTLYDKIIDADAGLIYINYETNWGNTTIRAMDNTTWIGSMISGEENSIWTFVTDYGLHNITVVIYNDGVPWFTDIFSFTIIVPYQIWKELTFIFTSSYDSAVIPAYDYLDIYLNDGMKYIGVVQYDVFNISVYDRFGQLLYAEVDRLYSETISISLPLRNISFINSNPVTVSYIVTRSIYTQSLLVATGGTSFFYLKDATYPISVVALEPCPTNGYVYVSNTTTFVSSVSNTEVNMTLGTEFVSYLTSPMTLTFRSSFDSGMIDPEYYLDIYLDGGTIEYHFETWKPTFNLTIYDKFNNLIYENSTFIFATTGTVYLPLRQISFTNSEFTLLLLDISTTTVGGFGLEKAFASQEANSLYLFDSDYTFTYFPMDEYKDDDELYVVTTVEETTTATNNAFTITLKTKRDRPLLLDIDWTNLDDFGDLMRNNFLSALIYIFAISAFVGFITVSTRRILKKFKKEEQESDEKRDKKIEVIYNYADKKLTQEEASEEIENAHRKEKRRIKNARLKDPTIDAERLRRDKK